MIRLDWTKSSLPGLDPAIHRFRKKMDARVKPAHDRRNVGMSPHSVEHLAAGGDRLCRHQHEGGDAGCRALVQPVVGGAALPSTSPALRCTLVTSSSMSISPEITIA